jgi:hypothetical protein
MMDDKIHDKIHDAFKNSVFLARRFICVEIIMIDDKIRDTNVSRFIVYG